MTLVVGLGALGLTLFLLARLAATPTMALLYSGLDSTAASGVIEGLDRRGVPYDVRGDAIYVPADQRDRVRIQLAGEGLPAAGAAGYELLDSISGFGTTAEMFDAAYWRAKEGELARTILASQRVVRARVHIAQSRRRPFEAEKPVTASVTVATSAGALSRTQAEAIRYLVASAVAGLSVQDVAVIDQDAGVILRSGEQEAEAGASDEAAAQAAALKQSVTRLLEARVGPGAAIVEVWVDTLRDSETVRERVLDPSRRAVIHSETESSEDSSAGGADSVTVASNLPDGDAGEAAAGDSRKASSSRERLNFDVSETVVERIRPPGEVRRVTVAAMIDGVRTEGPDGAPVWAPRPAEEIESLNALIQAAIGFDETRGDAVTIETMEFTEVGPEGAVAGGGVAGALAANASSLIQAAILGAVALLLGLFVLRPILTGRGGQAPALPAPDPAEAGGAAGGADRVYAGGAPAYSQDGLDFFSADSGDPIAMPGGGYYEAGVVESDRRDLVESIVAEKPEEAARLIGAWLDEAETDEAEAAPA